MTSKEYPTSDAELGYSPFHARLVLLVNQAKSMRAFAIAAGISQGGLQRILNGGEPTLGTLLAIAKSADVSVEWLATGRGAWPPHLPKPEDACIALNVREVGASYESEPVSPEVLDTLGRPVYVNDFIFIPRYFVVASAGHGAVLSDENRRDTMAFRRQWLEDTFYNTRPEDIAAISVIGDSMEPTIKARDVILIDRSDNTPSEGIFVISLDGRLMTKRLQPQSGDCILIISDNPLYPSQKLSGERLNDMVISGRVRWVGRTI